MEKQNNTSDQDTPPADSTPKVTGIGGIFFFTDNPQETKEWYSKNLGLEINEWGASSFDSRNIDKPEEINTLQWSPLKQAVTISLLQKGVYD